MAETHVIIALNRKYAELLGEVKRHQHEARKLRKSMMHVEATIRLFRADYDVSEISPVIPYKAVRWRTKGQGIRFAIEALRDAKRPMTTQELAIAAMKRGGLPTSDLQAVRDVIPSLRGSLKHRIGRGVVMIEGRPVRWALAKAKI